MTATALPLRVLVLGGAGFIGRHIAAALAARGHAVEIGSRHPASAARRLPTALHGARRLETHLERLLCAEDWEPLVWNVAAVVNSVGILRERGRETYERVHHLAPAALAAACERHGVRLIHISALGLREEAASRFLRSKLAGERAVMASGADCSIVRPALLDGENGYGARWLRGLARWPVHFVPADAAGRLAVLDVKDLGEAVAALCEARGRPEWREVELGGTACPTIGEYLALLRAKHAARPAARIEVPAWMARLGSHACDLLHFSPFSFGHLELLRRNNMPRVNRLRELIGRAPTAVVSYGSLLPTTRPAGRSTAPARADPSSSAALLWSPPARRRSGAGPAAARALRRSLRFLHIGAAPAPRDRAGPKAPAP
ncbi:MAG TPA: NAD(P)H-binding protein [Burkholderiales bacterium]